MEHLVGCRSVGLDARELDHLALLFSFVSNELSEVSRRACERNAADVGEAGLDFGVGDAPLNSLCFCGIGVVFVIDLRPVSDMLRVVSRSDCCNVHRGGHDDHQQRADFDISPWRNR
jgi:hypothetical protein